MEVGDGGDDEDYESEGHNKLDYICLHTLSVQFLINVCLPSSLSPCTRRDLSLHRPSVSLVV